MLETDVFGSCEIVSESLRMLEELEQRKDAEFHSETDIIDEQRLTVIARISSKLAGKIIEKDGPKLYSEK